MALSPQTLVVTMALILPGFPEHGNAPTVSFGAELPLYWSIVDNYEWAYQYEARARFGLFRINRTARETPDGSFPRRMTEGARAMQAVIALRDAEAGAARLRPDAPW